MATRWATLRSVWWALCQCRAMLLVPLLLNALFLTGQGSELVGSLYDETRSASAWFTFAAMLLLCFQVWYWSRLRLELGIVDAIAARTITDLRAKRIAANLVPIALSISVAASQLWHLWRAERFGLVVLISVVSVLVMTAAVIAYSRVALRHNASRVRKYIPERYTRRVAAVVSRLLQLPRATTKLAIPFWRRCMLFSICASIGCLLFALSLGRTFALAVGTIGIVILAMAIYVPLLAAPRLIFRNTSWPITLIFLLVPLLLPLAINFTSLNDSGTWPQLLCIIAILLGLGLLWKGRTTVAFALALLGLLSFVSLQNYSKVAYRISSIQAGEPARLQTPLRDEVSRWIGTPRRDTRAPPYIFFVNAAGGGIRAAYWTTSVLGRITDCSPQFPDRLFAISGVSGGSFGAVLYSAQLRNALNRYGDRSAAAAPPLCARHPLSAPDVPLPAGAYQTQAKQILSYDFLTPVLNNYLFRDVASAFLPLPPGPDRAIVFEHEISNAWQSHCGPTMKEGKLTCTPANLDQTSFFSLRTSLRAFRAKFATGVAWQPILLLNGTHQESGKRIITSHLKISQNTFSDAYDFTSGMTHADIPIAAAILNSARFPIVSPSGVVVDKRNSDNSTLGHVIDGGYFENNGAATLQELILKTMNIWPKDRKRPTPVVIEILNNPDYVEQDYAVWNEVQEALGITVDDTAPPADKRAPTLLAQMAGALQGLYNTAGGREVMASKSLIRTMHDLPEGIFIQFRLCPDMNPSPPLGWLLTERSQRAMDEILLGIGQRRSSSRSGGATMAYLNCFNANQRSLAQVLALLNEQ
ncbi:MAG: hypothetical protein ACOZAM_29125 [Pseudomonadota bacterium]